MEWNECAAVVVSLLSPYLRRAERPVDGAPRPGARSVARNQEWLRCQTIMDLVKDRPLVAAPLAVLEERPDDAEAQALLETRLGEVFLRDTALMGRVWTELLREEGRCVLDMAIVLMTPLIAEGYVLDVGGGGEGIIGRLAGDRVVAIDASRRELEEAPDGPLKIVMNVCDLAFLSGSFETATCFFSLMYLRAEERWDAIQQIARVLKPGGKLLIWDTEIPVWEPGTDELIVVPLLVQTPEEEILTGYGVSWEGREQSAEAVVALGHAAGLEVTLRQTQGSVFHLEMVKPANGDDRSGV